MVDSDYGQDSLVVGNAAGGRTVRLWVVGKSVDKAAGLDWLEQFLLESCLVVLPSRQLGRGLLVPPIWHFQG